MLERLSFGGLEIDKSHISALDVYCSDRAKRILEGGSLGIDNLFDRLCQVVIGPIGQTNPAVLPRFCLIERNKFYGVNGSYLPAQALADIFEEIYMGAPIELPEPKGYEQQAPKHLFLKSVWHKNQIGKEFQLEFKPEVALDLTQKLREYLLEELLIS